MTMSKTQRNYEESSEHIKFLREALAEKDLLIEKLNLQVKEARNDKRIEAIELEQTVKDLTEKLRFAQLDIKKQEQQKHIESFKESMKTFKQSLIQKYTDKQGVTANSAMFDITQS